MGRVTRKLRAGLRRLKMMLAAVRQMGVKRQMVWVYQMGKVASSSIYVSLRQIPSLDVSHAHCISPENIARVRESHRRRGMAESDHSVGTRLYRHVENRKPEKDVRIITLVREPVGRNISAFFQNLDVFEKTDAAHRKLPLPQLIDDFMDQYDHDTPLAWFDREMKTVTGIDVYAHPFDHEQGWLEIHSGRWHLLVMRHDLDDRIKEERIAEFLRIPPFELVRSNEAHRKDYSPAYAAFLDEVALPEEYVAEMLDSQYARHFFSPEERRRLRVRWTRSQTECQSENRCHEESREAHPEPTKQDSSGN